MKKIKSLFAVVILAAFTISCTKEDSITTNEVQNQNVMRFASEKEMNEKIAEIEAFKASQEEQIKQKLLQRNNLAAPTLEDIKNAKSKELTVLDKNSILEDVKFYHGEKLKAIYAERAHFGFTSIQSIADEINSLKLVDNKKYINKINENEKVLHVSNYDVLTAFDKIKSLIANKEGVFYLKDKELKLKNINHSASSNRTYESIDLVATGYNNFIQILCRRYAGEPMPVFSSTYSILHYTVTIKNSTNCWFLTNTGYVSYPCYHYINSGSFAKYAEFGTNSISTLHFKSGIGALVEETGVVQTQTNNGIVPMNGSGGSVGGNFAVQVAGTSNFLWVSGTKTF